MFRTTARNARSQCAVTIGKAIAATLATRHEVLLASREKSLLRVDIADPASIQALCRGSGQDARATCGAGILARRLFLPRSCIA